MNDWFEWRGQRCTDYGIHVITQPAITIPAERASYTNVPGRPGSLTVLEGSDVYDDMILTADCYLADPAQIPAIGAWLKGGGTVSFANRQGGFYYARITNQIPFEIILRGNPQRTFSVNFRCKPFWYAANPEPVTITESTGTITNPGSVYSEPIITVNGSGEITLMVGQRIIELSDIVDSITLDSELQEAYRGTVSMNACMSGDFPILKPGLNGISWTGDVTSVLIQPNWRYL